VAVRAVLVVRLLRGGDELLGDVLIPVIQQQPGALQVAPVHRSRERGVPLRVLVRPHLILPEQRGDHLGVPAPRGGHQRGSEYRILRVQVHA